MADNLLPFPGRHGTSPRVDESGNLEGGELPDAADSIAAWAAPQGFSGVREMLSLYADANRTLPNLLKPRPDKATFVVRLDLDGAKPPIWRRLRLASDMPLSELHQVIQLAMGWTDSHLHHFQMGPRVKDFRMIPFATGDDFSDGDVHGIFEGEVRLDQVLAEPGDRLFYEYDFGDAWHHTIKLEQIEGWAADAPDAACIAGRRACPPEDVGGISGYELLLDALAGKIEPDEADWLAEQLDWLPDGFDPAEFDVDQVNELLTQGPLPELDRWRPELLSLLARSGLAGLAELGASVTSALSEGPDDLTDDEAERATERYRMLLRAVGESVKLTAAGYLQPRLVESVYSELDLDREWVGRGNREDQTLPVLSLRQSATAVGLLRKAKGTLSVTLAGRKLASDPRGMLDHIAARLPLGRDHEQDAGLLGLLFVAAGQNWYDSRTRAAAVFTTLGWRAERLDLAVFHAAGPTLDVLDHLAGGHSDPQWRSRIARFLLARVR